MAQQLAAELAHPVAEGVRHPNRTPVELAPITLPDLTPIASAVQRGTKAPPAIALAPLVPVTPPAANHADAARHQAATQPAAPSTHTPTHHTVVAPGDQIHAPELAKLTDIAAREVAQAIAQGAHHKRSAAPSDHSSIAATLGGQEVSASRHAAREGANTAPQRHAHQRALVRELRDKTIPRLQRRVAKLSTVDPLGFDSTAADPLAISSDTDRATKLAEAQTELATAQDRADNLSGLIRTRRGRRAVDITPLEAAAAIAGAIPPIRGGEALALGARALFRGGAEAGAETAARGAAAHAVEAAAAPTAETALDVGGRTLASRAALAATERAAGQQTAESLARAITRAAESTPGKIARPIARVGGRAATYPIRHPFKVGVKYPLLAQAPLVVVHGDLGEFKKAFSSEGVMNQLIGGISDSLPANIVTNFAKDMISLPAQLVPSAYITLDAIVSGVGGDWGKAQDLWHQYLSTGVIPALAEGHIGEAAKRFEAHPLFGALELRGVQALVGRSAGALARRAPQGSALEALGNRSREPLALLGDQVKNREYSPDLIESSIQRLLDARRERKQGGQIATRRERNNAMDEITDREVHGNVSQQRAARNREAHGGADVAGLGIVNRLRGKRLSEPDKEGVSYAIQGIVTSPETFTHDLGTYGVRLQHEGAIIERKIAAADNPIERADLQKTLDANRAQLEQVKSVLKDGNPETIFAAARETIRSSSDPRSGLAPTRATMVEKGALDESQTYHAERIPAARLADEGAHYGIPNKVQAQIDKLKETLKAESSRDEQKVQGRAVKAGDEILVDGKWRRVESAERGQSHGNTKYRNLITKDENGNTKVVVADPESQISIRRGTSVISDAAKRLGRSENSVRLGMQNMINRLSKQTQILDRNGDPFDYAALEAKRQATPGSLDELGFISHNPREFGRKAYWQPMAERPRMQNKRRTGESTVTGNWDSSYDAVVEQRIRQATIGASIKGVEHTFNEIAVVRERYPTAAKAHEVMDNPEWRAKHGIPSDVQLRTVRLAPLGAKSSEIRAAEEAFDHYDPEKAYADRRLEGAEGRVLESAFADGPGPVIIVTSRQATRLAEHYARASTARRTFQVLSSLFKTTVLPFKPRWYTSNWIDLSFRSMTAGVAPPPFSYAQGSLARRVLKQLEDPKSDLYDPDLADRVRGQFLGGTLFGQADTSRVHRDATQFAETKLEPLARAAYTLKRTPGVREVVELIKRGAQAGFALNEMAIERQAQYALLSKAMKAEVAKTRGQWEATWRASDDAVRDLAKGLRETPTQIAYAKKIERTTGQWYANSPTARAFLVDYAPFAMWTRAAIKFMLVTLPRDHPILTSMATIAHEATQKEREALGLDQFIKGRLPENLQGAIPKPDGGLLPTNAVASPGYFDGFLNNLASTILPQFPLEELSGFDFTGQRLSHADGTPLNVIENAGVVLQAAGESFIPFFAIGKSIADKGFAYTFSPFPHSLDAAQAAHLRQYGASQQITVPAAGQSSSSSPLGGLFSGPTFNLGGSYGSSSSGGYGSTSGYGSGTPSFGSYGGN